MRVTADVSQSSSWETCPSLPTLVHRSSGRCPQPHPPAAGRSHPHGCYATGRTKERHREAKNGAIERRGSTGISLPALNRLLVPSSHWLRDGPTRNGLGKQFPWRSDPHEVQPEGQHLKEQNGAFSTRASVTDSKRRLHMTASPLFPQLAAASVLTGSRV